MISLVELELYDGALKGGLEPHELDQIFYRLAGATAPDVILEIGSRDFMDGLKIKAASPSSAVFAFEANPENFSEHLKNVDQIIFPMPIALGEKNCIETIKVPKYASRSQNASVQQRGIASILQRDDLGEFIEYEVPMMTLDSFMMNFSNDCANFAMWIDVEGYAYEVVSGASRRLLDKCMFIKVEVEDIGYWNGQRLAGDMRGFMARHDFTEIANCDRGLKQYDIIFANNKMI